jgi:phosphate uptake regulator
MAIRFFRGRDDERLVGIESKIQTMLRLDRHEFDLAMRALNGSAVGAIDTPAVLVYMSVVKDVERIGDYAKNLVDLARDGADFSRVPDAEEWRRIAAEVSEAITETGSAFGDRDGERARRLMSRGGRMLGEFDRAVSALVRADDPASQAVARALAWRYLKRVVAHQMNILSAVVMPLDRLDYFDEDPEDRV